MLPMPYRAAELEPLLAHGGARAVICYAGMEGYDVGPVMAGLCDALPAMEIVIAIGDTRAGAVRYEALLASDIAEITDPPDADDPAVLAFTSGTSAAPKAIVHNHRTLSAAYAGGQATFVLSASDVVMCAPAYTHAFGLIVVVTTLAAGAESATMAAYSPAALAETIQRTGATVFCGGPVHVFMGEKAGLWGPEVTRTLARSYIGGAPTPAEAVRIIDDASANGRAYQLWGMSEVLLPIMPPLDSP
jgi:acyl-coenzyme A synthetase/AMP-(fatty) acid ligase